MSQIARTDTPNHQVAIIHGRTAVLVDRNGQTVFSQLKGRHLKPVCGDWVRIDQAGHVIEVGARQNEFPRVDARGRKRTVAANLDRVLIVVAPKPAPSAHLVDRYLLACHAVGIDAALIINKTDQIEAGQKLAHVDTAMIESLGYPVLAVSAKQGRGIEPLAELIDGGTAILVGQSGVGKSTIANRLVPDLDVQTRTLSTATGKGRHTTSASTLYQLPAGGQLIDSPGVWEFGIWHLSDEEIAAGFIEFANYCGQCRFNNCKHLGEPDCAIVAAVAAGQINSGRYRAYQEIIATNQRGAR